EQRSTRLTYTTLFRSLSFDERAIAARNRIGRSPVARTPAQAKRVTSNHATLILHVGAFVFFRLDVGNPLCGRGNGNHCGCSEDRSEEHTSELQSRENL